MSCSSTISATFATGIALTIESRKASNSSVKPEPVRAHLQRLVFAPELVEEGRAAGEPFAVHHFHDARRSPANTALQATDLFVGRDQMVIGVGEVSGSLWMIDLRN